MHWSGATHDELNQPTQGELTSVLSPRALTALGDGAPLGLMQGYVVQITHPSSGSGLPRAEHLYVMAFDERMALARASQSRDEGNIVHVVRSMSNAECEEHGLRPFQVKHA